MSFSQYLKDTQVELKHVAWPTQIQTAVYTVLVIGISVAIGLYIGFFDFFFTRGLEEFLKRSGTMQKAPIELNQQPVDTSTPVNFDLSPASGENMPVITNVPAPEVN